MADAKKISLVLPYNRPNAKLLSRTVNTGAEVLPRRARDFGRSGEGSRAGAG
jgi:hypothetical protein